jgi:hypothetical protein
MKAIEIPEDIFADEQDFHRRFSILMGFPGFYGHNWNAWIDCMSYIDDPSAEMSQVLIALDESLEIRIIIKDGNTYYRTTTWGLFCSCVAAVNGRFLRRHSSTRLIVTEQLATE